MEKNVNTFIEKFKNPMLWITIILAIFWIVRRLDKVEVIEERLTKKIEIQNTIKEATAEVKSEMEIHKHEIEVLRLQLKVEAAQKEKEALIRHYEQELRLQTINNY